MMLKRLIKSASALLFVTTLWMAPQARAAGTIPLAMAQQVDINGAPLANCQLSFFVAGTPAQQQDSFSDFGLSQKNPWPLTCDQAGRIPMFWLADGLIHARLTDSFGTPIIDSTLQVLGPSSGGGGGGGTVDPTTILATGDEKIRYGTGPLAGFVRENALTIGNATSGATERANADTQALFIYLYNINPNLVVSGGRTGNALSDFNASKQLTLPDMRGAAAAGLDDMGNSAKGVFAGVTFTNGNATTLDSLVGAARRTLSLGQLPGGISSTVSGVSVSAGSNGSVVSTNATESNIAVSSGAGNIVPAVAVGQQFFTNPTLAQTGTGTAVSNNTLGQAFDSVSPYALRTFYIKL